MSTEETAVINVNLILSNQVGDGELPDDEAMERIIASALWNFFGGEETRHEVGQTIDLLGVAVVARTGEL